MTANEERIEQITNALGVPAKQVGMFIRGFGSPKKVVYRGLDDESTPKVGDWVEVIDPEFAFLPHIGKLVSFDDGGAVIVESRLTKLPESDRNQFVTRVIERYMTLA